jgi:hypothetical protein
VAGYRFTTPTDHLKHDDSNICEPYRDGDGTTKHAYGQIRKMFVHEMYPGGPSKVGLRTHNNTNSRHANVIHVVLHTTRSVPYHA